jgi:hypothetical protein
MVTLAPTTFVSYEYRSLSTDEDMPSQGVLGGLA